ncbi:MAG: PTS sugar transporter subunit IIA [Treponema sp.]|nr:PTS sugar transporter subunit IIA [Treponema sp.]
MQLKDFILGNHAYALGAHVATCEEAIKLGTDLLVQAGVAEARYYQAVLDVKKEHGPYYVIAPGIAMPHARPESGALGTGFALVTLATPVNFGSPDNDPVDIVLCISAKDKDDLNNNVIIDVMTLFENEDIVADLRKATGETDLRIIFDKVEAMNAQ